jgi:hypothetical protein
MGHWYNINIKFTGDKPSKELVQQVSDSLEIMDDDFPVNHDESCIYLNGSGNHPFGQNARYRSPVISINEILKYLNRYFDCSMAVSNGRYMNDEVNFKDEDFLTYPTDKDWEDFDHE